MEKIVAWMSAVGFAFAGSVALAQQKPEDIIKYRQSALFLMGQHFGPLAAMAQGKIPYDKESAARNAAVVEYMSKLPWESFPSGPSRAITRRPNERSGRIRT